MTLLNCFASCFPQNKRFNLCRHILSYDSIDRVTGKHEFLMSPRFKVIDTCDKKQLVCLLGDDIPIHEESGVIHESAGSIFNSYTEWEALINHVHVFDNVKKGFNQFYK